MAPDSLVGLAVPNGPAFLAGFLALRRACQCPVLLDPSAPEEDLRRTITALGVTAMLSCSTGWPTSAADFHVTPIRLTTDPNTLQGIGVVKLTSGSTGAPRGVAMREESLLADEAALTLSMGFLNDDRIMGTIPLSHSYGFTTLVLSALVRGLPLILQSDQGPLTPLATARDLQATVFPTVPAYIQALLRSSQPPKWPSSIRLVISAGAPLPAGVAAQFYGNFGQRVHGFYGTSECGGICYDQEGSAAERGTVGTPVAGVHVSLTAQALGDVNEGLVTVMSAGVGDTYTPDPDPRLLAGRFETSDIGRWQDGELALTRRVDQVINVRGRKVDPVEIERVLEALDGVDEAAVIGVTRPHGDGEVIRAVVASAPGRLTYQRVSAWCSQNLAAHKVPRSLIIVDALPRTSRGKVDRRALCELSTPKTYG